MIAGDIICDPMCGTASICLEGVNSFPFSFHLGGEIHPDGCHNAANNIDYFNKVKAETNGLVTFPISFWKVQIVNKNNYYLQRQSEIIDEC